MKPCMSSVGRIQSVCIYIQSPFLLTSVDPLYFQNFAIKDKSDQTQSSFVIDRVGPAKIVHIKEVSHHILPGSLPMSAIEGLLYEFDKETHTVFLFDINLLNSSMEV